MHTRLLQVVLLLSSIEGWAQDLEPRSYTLLPVGQQFGGIGYLYSDGEINPAQGVPIEDAKLTVKALAAAYVRTLNLFGRAGKIDIGLLRTCFRGEAVVQGRFVRGDRCGLADPTVRLSYLFYGAPALSLAEFGRHPFGLVMGASLKVRAPLGDYNNENIVNHGANRWEFKPEVGLSRRFGSWTLEAAASVALFTENDRFAGRDRLEQDPLYQVQGHLTYHLGPSRWISLNTNYFWEGRTERNGDPRDDRQENSRIGVTFAMPLNRQHSLKFFASRGVVTRVGNDFDSFGVVWQYRWGPEG